jgi:hypothetical protein
MKQKLIILSFVLFPFFGISQSLLNPTDLNIVWEKGEQVDYFPPVPETNHTPNPEGNETHVMMYHDRLYYIFVIHDKQAKYGYSPYECYRIENSYIWGVYKNGGN